MSRMEGLRVGSFFRLRSRLLHSKASKSRRCRHLVSCHKANRNFGVASIGAEYGEGFEAYTASSLTPVDVAALNTHLRTRGAQRLRHAMKPDEALGAIFAFEGILADTRPLWERSWKALAQEYGQSLMEPLGPHMYDSPPVKVIIKTLEWTRDVSEARSMTARLQELYSEFFLELDKPYPGVREWLIRLEKTKVPCAVVSHMSREDLQEVLKKMDLEDLFEAEVTFEDDMETIAQQCLCAAMKLQRPPDHCVVFDASPMGIAAAHNCTMKAVAVQGYYRGYQLKQADLTCASLDELKVYNLRRLFANRGSEFMDHMKGKEEVKEIRQNTVATF